MATELETVLEPLQAVAELSRRGALFVINHSGGKDSQAMFHYVRQLVDDSQIVIVHAALGRVEWSGTWEHVVATTDGLPCYQVSSRRSLLEMIQQRGMFPSPTLRQCTSDLKRGPIEKQIRAISKARDCKLIVNCMGLRADESPARSKQQAFRFNARNSKAGREWYDWLPIHGLTTAEVFEIIARVGQHPHWAYAQGMTRLSCCFCIMASKADLTTAARLNPALYADYVKLEKLTGHVMIMPTKKQGARGLEAVTGVVADMSLATV